ncbi:MAG: 1-acyl-sn-glycerol-3-phosphate acyltransferase [Bacteroidales bacterium]|nr:1-acyl-sn-glycerol-3-phosphate acyltransferase [Bacteroidales bacterium]
MAAEERQEIKPVETDDWYKIDVDAALKAKAGKVYKYIPKFVINYLKHIVHQDELNQFVDSAKNVIGIPFAKTALDYFGCNLTVSGLENVPDNGRFIFVSNHPMGGLDGMAFMYAVSGKYTDIKFPVNDLLLYVKNFEGIFLPVNKTGVTGRNAATLMEEAFAGDSQMLMFPAGLCSRKIDGKIQDLEWKKSVVAKAVQTKRDIVPLYISGRNSNFFYNLSKIRRALGIKVNIEMLYLVDEMYKQKGHSIDIKFGSPISYTSFEGRKPYDVAQELRQMVYTLA